MIFASAFKFQGLVGAFSVIVKTLQRFVDSSSMDTSHLSLVSRGSGGVLTGWCRDIVITFPPTHNSHFSEEPSNPGRPQGSYRGRASQLQNIQINLNIFLAYLLYAMIIDFCFGHGILALLGAGKLAENDNIHFV